MSESFWGAFFGAVSGLVTVGFGVGLYQRHLTAKAQARIASDIAAARTQLKSTMAAFVATSASTSPTSTEVN